MKKSLFVLSMFSLALLAGCGEKADVQQLEVGHQEVTQPSEQSTLVDGNYDLAAGQTLNWEAFKAVGGHAGTVALKSGELSIEDGQLKSGTFIVDMNSIATEASDPMAEAVTKHLKADDFFTTTNYPVSRFEIANVSAYEGEEAYDYSVEGNLTVREITAPVTVLVHLEQTGDTLNIHARSEVDRTAFGINFRSGSVFQDLGDSLIKDIFNIEMTLIAVPRG